MTAKSSQLEPSLIVIFGITGDLSQRYLLPALYHLIKDGLLHEQTDIIGISRRGISADELLDNVELCINEIDKVCDPVALKQLHQRTRMVQMDPTDGSAYGQLRQTLDAIEEEKGMCLNRLYYLSIPPQVYGPVIRLMGEAELNTSCQHGNAKTRLLVEKPFGYDLESAKALIDETAAVFKEEQLFRIDHYLAKETAQNILTFRFENPIFEAVWNNQLIDRIEISASEKIGVEGRANFYDNVGALRDFIQSHLMQLLAIVTMDKPAELDSEHIHTNKQAVLRQVLAVPADRVAEETSRAQYEGYRAEVKNPDSNTETLAAVRLFINSPRWQDVPILLWTGKKLDQKKTEISVSFKREGGEPNFLRFRIQPNEGIELDLLAKKPGFDSDLQTAAMDFSYRQNFGDQGHPDAYERVLVDAIRGDRTLFTTSDEVLEAWRILQPVLDHWGRLTDAPPIYKPGSTGEELIKTLR